MQIGSPWYMHLDKQSKLPDELRAMNKIYLSPAPFVHRSIACSISELLTGIYHGVISHNEAQARES